MMGACYSDIQNSLGSEKTQGIIRNLRVCCRLECSASYSQFNMLILGVTCSTCYATGRLKVTDVMFPGGSPALVEPIYSNPLLSAPFNEQLAAAVVGYVKQRLQVRLGLCLGTIISSVTRKGTNPCPVMERRDLVQVTEVCSGNDGP